MTAATTRVGVSRAAHGPLRDAYPVGEHDIELRVAGAAVGDLPHLLAEITPALFAEHPACRRVVVAVPVDDAVIVAAVEAGGYRYVVDVETRGGEQLSLLVADRAHR